MTMQKSVKKSTIRIIILSSRKHTNTGIINLIIRERKMVIFFVDYI
jgi:hypothetical protein